MELLGLPGRNPETEAWMAGLLDSLGFGTGRVVHYRHWDDGGEPDHSSEAGRLRGLEPDLVIAKSMGTLVAASAHAMYDFRPRAAVLIGSPIAHLPREVLSAYSQLGSAVPTLFIQQEEDFTASFAVVEAVASKCTLGEAVAIPGSDHVYADVDTLVTLIRRWRQAH